MNYLEAINSLLKGVTHLIETAINKAPIDKTFTGMIKSVKEDNLYDVVIDNVIYENVPSLFTGFQQYDTVKIKVPQNQFSEMYIEGKFNMK